MRLRPGFDVLWRAPGEVQIGTDPRWAIRLTDLTDSEADLLAKVEPGASTRALHTLAVQRGVPGERVERLLRLLADAHLLCPEPTRPPPTTALSSRACDAAVWSLVLEDGDGAGLVRARAECVVGVVGLGRLGLQVAVTLASAGVGTLLLEDPFLVKSADLGVGGYLSRDVGSTRTTAARRIVHDIGTEIRTHASPHMSPDLIVLVEHGAADPARARMSMSTGIPHLSVVIREASALVGPLVIPGRTPCLRCVDLWRAQADERWAVLAAQLSAASRPPAHEETTLAAVCGALAAAQALAHLDGRTATVRGASLEVSLPEAVPRLREWTPHPDCGCRQLPPTPSVRMPSAAGRVPS
jgi:bacteriocin biosynthesis cyclodehydratase domain-containing protein